MWAIGAVQKVVIWVNLAPIVIGRMDNATIWFIDIAMKIGYEKSDSRNGGRDTMERMPMKHRVTTDMAIGDTLLELLLC